MIRGWIIALAIGLGACTDDTGPLDGSVADVAGDAGTSEPIDGGVEDRGVHDGGPQRGTQEWCDFVNATNCTSGDECAPSGPRYINDAGYCDCLPGQRHNWREVCRGQINGLCRDEEPRCEPGAQCEDQGWWICVPDD